MIATEKDIGKEGPIEFLERVREQIERKGGKNLLFRVLNLKDKSKFKYYLIKASEHYNIPKEQFIVALKQPEAALQLEDKDSSIQVYEKGSLLETLYSNRGIYQLPPAKIFRWEGRRI